MKKTLVTMLAVSALFAVLPTATPAGAQPPMCFGQPATIIARPGVPTVGTPGPDVIVGTAGSDVIRGRGGDDRICARSGADDVEGGGGADMMDLGGGADTAAGGKGRDTIFGRGGPDTINGNGGADSIFGNKGADTISGGGGRDVLAGGAGRDDIRGNQGRDDCRGGAGQDDIGNCNEPLVSIDLDDAYVTAADLGGAPWEDVEEGDVPNRSLLRICGRDIEGDIGIADFGRVRPTFDSSDQTPVLRHSIRIQTERTAPELITKTNAAIEPCSWDVRDDENGVTTTFTIDSAATGLAPRGESFSAYITDMSVDFDDPATPDAPFEMAIIQIQCGPVISRLAVQGNIGTIPNALLDTMSLAAETRLAAALVGSPYSC